MTKRMEINAKTPFIHGKFSCFFTFAELNNFKNVHSSAQIQKNRAPAEKCTKSSTCMLFFRGMPANGWHSGQTNLRTGIVGIPTCYVWNCWSCWNLQPSVSSVNNTAKPALSDCWWLPRTMQNVLLNAISYKLRLPNKAIILNSTYSILNLTAPYGRNQNYLLMMISVM